VSNRQPEYRNRAIIHKGLIFIISGPSGSGKTTLIKKLLGSKQLKGRFVRSVSLTTRPKRPGENNSRDYFFITKQEFKQRLAAKQVLEWTRYLGYHYATPKYFVDRQIKQGKGLILCLDLRGALRIKRLYPKNTITIFITPPSLKALRDRIQKRCSKAKMTDVRRRLKLARQEIRGSHHYDYRLINRDLSDTAKRLKAIVLNQMGIRS
jgi:guanylate kinase